MLLKVVGTSFVDTEHINDLMINSGYLERYDKSSDNYFITFEINGVYEEPNGVTTDPYIYLEREPNNPYDPNAIKVMVNGDKLGYLPKEEAKKIASKLVGKYPVRKLYLQHYLQDENMNDSYTIEF